MHKKLDEIKADLLHWAGPQGWDFSQDAMPRLHEIIDKIEQLEQENERLQKLVRGYYTLLHVIHHEYWQDTMTPFWIKHKDKLQAQASGFVTQEKEQANDGRR